MTPRRPGRPLQSAALAVLLLAGAGPASAQTVWRCGDHSYSQAPCPGGVAVTVDDARTPEQKADADSTTQRDTEAADALARERAAQPPQQQMQAAEPAEPAASSTDEPERRHFIIRRAP